MTLHWDKRRSEVMTSFIVVRAANSCLWRHFGCEWQPRQPVTLYDSSWVLRVCVKLAIACPPDKTGLGEIKVETRTLANLGRTKVVHSCRFGEGYSIWNPQGGKNPGRPPHIFIFSRTPPHTFYFSRGRPPPHTFYFFSWPPQPYFCNPPPPPYFIDTPPRDIFYTCKYLGKNTQNLSKNTPPVIFSTTPPPPVIFFSLDPPPHFIFSPDAPLRILFFSRTPPHTFLFFVSSPPPPWGIQME